MAVLGIDPGPTQSAVVIWDGVCVREHCILDNDAVLNLLTFPVAGVTDVAIERISMGGMVAGVETFDTCVMVGRFFQQVTACQSLRGAGEPYWSAHYLKRQEVKKHHLGQVRGNDAQIRAALVERFGPYKEHAIGTKRAPGIFYGVKSHEWAALAVAIAWHDRQAA